MLHTDPFSLLDVIDRAKSDGYVSCIDLTAVDYDDNFDRPGLPPEIVPGRYEISIVLISHSPPDRLRIRVQVDEADPKVPTLFDAYPSAEPMEREVFDMFGIDFTGHPNLTRILMPDDWEGHPLRKDFPTGDVPVQFKITPKKTGAQE